jgi:hypothetical protein
MKIQNPGNRGSRMNVLIVEVEISKTLKHKLLKLPSIDTPVGGDMTAKAGSR